MALFAGAPLRTIECVMVTTGARVPAARGGVGAWWAPSRGPGGQRELAVSGGLVQGGRAAGGRWQARGAGSVLPVHPSGGGGAGPGLLVHLWQRAELLRRLRGEGDQQRALVSCGDPSLPTGWG